MNIDIYMPRLDVTFKKGPIPEERGPIPALRKYWMDFCLRLRDVYVEVGHQVRILEVPLWQITEDLVDQTSKNANIIYIPHKMKLNWYLDDRVLYYMQMVIPSIFSIDKDGWCASAKNFPITPKANQIAYNIYAKLQGRIEHNTSKFLQPNSEEYNLPDTYIFFPCQIPHDETIQYHSDVSIESCFAALLKSLSLDKRYSLVIKGHPANAESMKGLKNIYDEFKSNSTNDLSNRALWINDCSVHRLIKKSKAVFTVNSGVGLEALLHGKPVYTFGDADYAYASTKIAFGGNIDNAALAVVRQLDFLESVDQDQVSKRAEDFIEAWYSTHFDCENNQTFRKVLNF